MLVTTPPPSPRCEVFRTNPGRQSPFFVRCPPPAPPLFLPMMERNRALPRLSRPPSMQFFFFFFHPHIFLTPPEEICPRSVPVLRDLSPSKLGLLELENFCVPPTPLPVSSRNLTPGEHCNSFVYVRPSCTQVRTFFFFSPQLVTRWPLTPWFETDAFKTFGSSTPFWSLGPFASFPCPFQPGRHPPLPKCGTSPVFLIHFFPCAAPLTRGFPDSDFPPPSHSVEGFRHFLPSLFSHRFVFFPPSFLLSRSKNAPHY